MRSSPINELDKQFEKTGEPAFGDENFWGDDKHGESLKKQFNLKEKK